MPPDPGHWLAQASPSPQDFCPSKKLGWNPLAKVDKLRACSLILGAHCGGLAKDFPS